MQRGNFYLKPIYLVLKEARERKGVTLDQAQRDTKIHHKILHALEEGTALDLGPVYLKSYIKLYAQYLGIEKSELDRYLNRDVREQKREVVSSPQTTMAGYEDTVSKLPNFSFQLKPKNIFVILFVLLLLVSFFKFVGRPKSKDSAHANTNTEKVASSVAAKKVEAKSKQTPKKETKVAARTPKGVKDILRLTILAEEDTWMQVKSDGKVVFKRILKKGTSETWQAKEGFDLWLANAGTIKLELNGKIMPPIGRRGQLIKSALITRDGFKINR